MKVLPERINTPGLEALVLFGSEARGDSDRGSDVDIAAFGRVSRITELIELKRSLASKINTKTNVSAYSTATAELMARTGSLFLWHLKLEGKVLASQSDWYDNVLYNLVPYSLHKAYLDLSTFRVVLSDIQSALRRSTSTVLFETSTMFSVLRSMGMIVSMVDNHPCFSRLQPILYLRSRLSASFGLNPLDVQRLYRAKLFYSRKHYRRPALDIVWSRQVVGKISEILACLERSL